MPHVRLIGCYTKNVHLNVQEVTGRKMSIGVCVCLRVCVWGWVITHYLYIKLELELNTLLPSFNYLDHDLVFLNLCFTVLVPNYA